MVGVNLPKSLLPEATEWISPLPPEREIAPVTHVRGTLLAASREQVRAAGRFADYERLLTPAARAELDTTLANAWFSIDLAHVHYTAVDRLGLAEPEAVRMTEEVSRRLSGPFMQTMSSTLRTTGLTPWDIVPFYDKVWRRLFVGGALAVAKVGPKDARMVIAGHPLIKYRYHRIGIATHLVIGVQFLVAKRAYVRELRVDPVAGRADLLLQWV
jgi:hypothetical protein